MSSQHINSEIAVRHAADPLRDSKVYRLISPHFVMAFGAAPSARGSSTWLTFLSICIFHRLLCETAIAYYTKRPFRLRAAACYPALTIISHGPFQIKMISYFYDRDLILTCVISLWAKSFCKGKTAILIRKKASKTYVFKAFLWRRRRDSKSKIVGLCQSTGPNL